MKVMFVDVSVDILLHHWELCVFQST